MLEFLRTLKELDLTLTPRGSFFHLTILNDVKLCSLHKPNLGFVLQPSVSKLHSVTRYHPPFWPHLHTSSAIPH